jgi:hypothetical protein
MSYLYLFNRAYILCVKANSHAIAHDLAYMSETELMGVINFLSQIVS